MLKGTKASIYIFSINHENLDKNMQNQYIISKQKYIAANKSNINGLQAPYFSKPPKILKMHSTYRFISNHVKIYRYNDFDPYYLFH